MIVLTLKTIFWRFWHLPILTVIGGAIGRALAGGSFSLFGLLVTAAVSSILLVTVFFPVIYHKAKKDKANQQ